MKLNSLFTCENQVKNWKAFALIAGLILGANLTACSSSQTASPDAMKGDAMKGEKGDAMKGDAMKGEKGDAMKGDAKKTPATKP